MITRINCKVRRLTLTAMSLIMVLFAWLILNKPELKGVRGTDSGSDSTDSGINALQKGWNKIPGGPGTSCSTGAPYYYFVRPGDPRRLLIHFQGGGACWKSVNCNLQLEPTYDPTVEDTDQPRETGIFDFANPENPFKDFTIVFVSYCTGDVHLGNRLVNYPLPATESRQASTFQINHKGYPNAMAAMRWIFVNISSPDSIFISGESAGAIASPFYAALAALHYKKSRVSQLGDSAGGYRTLAVTGLLEGWGAIDTIQSINTYRKSQDSVNFETLYINAARNLPSVRFSQFNAAGDSTQLHFLRLIGVEGVSLETLLEQNYQDIRKAAPRFRTFTALNKTHVIVSRREFYTLKVNGVRFSDWVANLVAGKAVENVKGTVDK